MIGTYNKEALTNIVEPLQAISSVFGNNSVHVVYENSDDDMFIHTVNQKKSVYAIYLLKVDDVIENYSSKLKEACIWDVKFFMNVLNKYVNPIYVDNVEINWSENAKNKIEIKCGNEVSEFYMSDSGLFSESRKTSRKLNTSSLTEACSFTLDGNNLKKLKSSIAVFEEQHEFVLSGNEGDDYISVALSSDSSTQTNKNTSKIEGVEVKTDFSLKFPKEDIKGLLACNDKFDIEVFTGPKSIMGATYAKEHYDMKFYFSPLTSN
jgi:hypothetical protein